jgi:hypothetical protein
LRASESTFVDSPASTSVTPAFAIAHRSQRSAATKAVVHRDEPPDAEMRRVPDEVPMTLEEEVLEVTLGGVVVRASRSGSDVKVDLGGVGQDAWAHLGRFLRSLGEGGAMPPLTGS